MDENLMDYVNKLDFIIEQVKLEIRTAVKQFGPFHNAHEGYAVLLEEVDELWDNVKMNQKYPERKMLIRSEAIQVAAMAIRLIYDCCD